MTPPAEETAPPSEEPTPEGEGEVPPAETEEEKQEEEEEKSAEQKEAEEIERIEEEFDNYRDADAAVETERLQEAVIARRQRRSEIHLLEPFARKYESRSDGNNAPCGPGEKGATHWMGSQGSKNFFQWRTLKAHHSSNCTLYISNGGETNEFRLMRPLDDSSDFDGKFPCGRKAGFEGKEIKLPLDLTCESCVIQLI